MRYWIPTALLFLIASATSCKADGVTAADESSARFTTSELKEDLEFLHEAVLQRHPRFHSEPMDAELLSAFDEANQSIRSPMTKTEAFRVFARINPAYKDAHTLILPTFGKEAAQPSRKTFPISVKLDRRGELVVVGTWALQDGSNRIESGAVIRTINGQDTRGLLDDLQQYSHGETKALRRHMLAVMFPDWLASVKGWENSFSLVVESHGKARAVEIMGEDTWLPAKASSEAEVPSLRDLGGGNWLLALPTFDVDEDPDSYRNAINSSFATLRSNKATGLVLDVRGNTGGQSDAGAQVVRYLADGPVNQVSRAQERLNEDNRGLLGYKGQVGDMREMDLSRDGLIKPVPAHERFGGPVVLLLDAMTYSAGILFATTLQDHGLAVLVGQPTGGFANQTGNMEPVKLPHTGLTAYIPARQFLRPNGAAQSAPVIPDCLTPIDGNGQDEDLSLALEILRTRQESNRTGSGTPRKPRACMAQI